MNMPSFKRALLELAEEHGFDSSGNSGYHPDHNPVKVSRGVVRNSTGVGYTHSKSVIFFGLQFYIKFVFPSHKNAGEFIQTIDDISNETQMIYRSGQSQYTITPSTHNSAVYFERIVLTLRALLVL